MATITMILYRKRFLSRTRSRCGSSCQHGRLRHCFVITVPQVPRVARCSLSGLQNLIRRKPKSGADNEDPATLK